MTREEAIKEAYGIPVTKAQHEALQFLIPELAESEDERIRKWLIEMVEEFRKLNPTNAEHNGNCSEAIAYLEKQKYEYEIFEPVESTLEYKIGFNAGKESIQKAELSDEDEEHIKSLLARLEGMCKKGATFTQTRFAVSEDIDWLKSISKRFVLQPKQEWSEEDSRILYNVIAYVGYAAGQRGVRDDEFKEANSWLKSIHERFNLQPKQEWSEEDDKFIKELCNLLASIAKNNYVGRYYAPDLVSKLQSLRHVKQKWNEDEIKVLNSIIDDYEKAAKSFCGYDGKLILLKSIRDGEYDS